MNRIVAFVTTGSQTTVGLAPVTDFLLWYARDKASIKYRPLLTEQERRSLAPTITWNVELEDKMVDYGIVVLHDRRGHCACSGQCQAR